MMLTMSHDNGVLTFGISLTLLCERSGVEVPLILGDILRWLAAHALAQPDVFAEASKSAATSHLKSAIDTGVSLADLVDGTRPAVVGSLLKRWLEELPDPLLNWDQQVELLSACKDEGCIEARIASLNVAVALVDPISLGTLKPLLLFLQQYCFRQRRFDQQLLQVAVAFAPILFPAALAAGAAELRLAEETVATLVSNALHVFNPTLAANVPVVTPQALCEAAAEIMESQEQQQQQVTQQDLQEPQPRDNAGYAAVSAPSAHHRHGLEVSSSLEQPTYLEQQLDDLTSSEEGQYEPYLSDGPFLECLHEMVDSCVAAALFISDGEHDATGWGMDDDCGSVASSCSRVLLSGGGVASSGGASSCSMASVAICCQGELCYPPHSLSQCHQHHHPHHPSHQHHHGSANVFHAAPCCRSTREAADKADAPYSPRAVLVTPLRTDALRLGSLEAQVASNKAAGVGVAIGKPVAAGMSPAVLAELAAREVSEGSVFCIISAQPGATAIVTATPAVGHGSGLCPSAAGRGGPDFVSAALQQRSQSAPASIADRQAATVDALQQPDQLAASQSISNRRPTEGGAGSDACSASRGNLGQGVQGQVVEQLCGSRTLTRPPGSLQPSETRQRRMTMGGGDGTVATAAPKQLQLHGSALQQQLPQLRSRSTAGSSNSSSGGGGGSSSGGGSCSSGGSASPQPADRLPPTASTSPSTQSVGCVAELGAAGHLRVSLTSALTLMVRELTTPEAMVHRVPIRSMSPTAMQSEKERLKRQLKEVAATYEAFAGRPLTQALKEPLRPVYVRYHKIKALLSSGRASSSHGTGGAAPLRTQQQLPLSLMPSPSASSRPSVVA